LSQASVATIAKIYSFSIGEFKKSNQNKYFLSLITIIGDYMSKHIPLCGLIFLFIFGYSVNGSQFYLPSNMAHSVSVRIKSTTKDIECCLGLTLEQRSILIMLIKKTSLLYGDLGKKLDNRPFLYNIVEPLLLEANYELEKLSIIFKEIALDFLDSKMKEIKMLNDRFNRAIYDLT
jgi:hypothetical protein